jgi:hypothetical protein
MRCPSSFHNHVIGVLSPVIAVALGVALAFVPGFAQNAIPPTAREAVALPAFASRLARHAPPQAAGKVRAPASGHTRTASPQDSVAYENGPVNGTTDAWDINLGYVVSDTFTLGSASTITGFDFYTWEFPGDTLSSVDWSITDVENGFCPGDTCLGNGTASGYMVSDKFISTNQYGFNIDKISVSGLNVSLSSGTVWLNLQNATVPSGDPVYWDENSGVGCNSQGCPSQAFQSAVGTIPSEAFDVVGNGGPPPCQGDDSSLVYSFTGGKDKGGPIEVTVDHAGNVYGLTDFTIFKLASSYLTTLYNFAGGSDGRPFGLVVGAYGTLYGTSDGGLQNCNGEYCGEVFSLAPSPTACKTALCPWVKTPLYQSTGTDDASHPSGPVVFDEAGNLYGIANGGYGSIYELTHSDAGWTEKVLYTFTEGRHGWEPASLLLGHDGNLYGTTFYGGAAGCGYYGWGCGTVFRLAPSGNGWTETVIYQFQGQSDGEGPFNLLQDGSGKLYGIAGATLFMLSPSNRKWKFTVLYEFTDYSRGDPLGLALEANGSLKGVTLRHTCDRCDGQQDSHGEVFELVPGKGGWDYDTLHIFHNWGANGGVSLGPDGYTVWGATEFGGVNCVGGIWKW